MQPKPMTRAQMRRAADALMMMLHCLIDWDVAADETGALGCDIEPENPRAMWQYAEDIAEAESDMILIEASMLMSEACRPSGHDGDGTD